MGHEIEVKRWARLTSFGDFGKSQAGAALQIDVVRIDEGAESIERTAGEEVGVLSVFEEIQQIRHGLALAVGQHILVVDSTAACDESTDQLTL